MVKRDGLYYLLYSCNYFRNIDYAVGYATATSSMGPWTKYAGNPILSRANTGWNGTGHGDLFEGKGGQLYYVLHTHHSNTSARGQRRTGIVKVAFTKTKPAMLTVDKESFHFLTIAK